MRTVPANFVPFQYRLDARYSTIVKIGSSDYLGDMEIEWGGGLHVYPLLMGHSGIKHLTDPFSKKWSVGEVTLTFKNSPFKRHTDGSWLRPSDDISVVETDTVNIYMLCGENAIGLSDCILYFSGFVKEPPNYDEHSWKITAIDRSELLLQEDVATTKISSIYSDAPEKYQDDIIPLVYGDFEYGETVSGWANKVPIQSQKGLCKGIPTDNEVPPSCVFADHVSYEFSSLFWVPSGFDDAGEFSGVTNRTLYTDSGGRTRSVTNANSNYQSIYLSISNVLTQDYSFESEGLPTNYKNVWDRNNSTYAVIKDNVSDNGTQIVGEGRWGFNNDHSIAGLKQEMIGNNPSFAHWLTGWWGVIYKAEPASGMSPTAYLRLYYDTDGTTDTYRQLATGALTLNNTWQVAIDTQNNPFADKEARYLIGLRATNSTGGDSSTDNQDMVKVYRLYFFVEGYMPECDYLWGQIKGREYGTWIDGIGRSNSYNQLSMIEEPCFIIESLLRDELNWIDSQIDEDSFDNAENASVVMRLNLTKQTTIEKVIRQICEQSTFMFHVSSAGKAKLIPLNESSPTTDRTIPFSHIKPDTLRPSKVGPYVNYLTYHSCYLPQLNKYRDTTTAYNTASWSVYGKHEHTVYWPNIEGSSVSHIYSHLMATSTGLWSDPRNVIEFETIGFTNADLEIGDWIELDDETWDAQLKLNGTSWSGDQFLITEVTQKQDGTRIKAIAI